MGETRAQSGHSRSSNSMIATFAPLGGFNAEVSLNAVALACGIAICAPAGTTETRAKAITKRFIVPPILTAVYPPPNNPSQIHDVISTGARSAEWRNPLFNPYRVSAQNAPSLFGGRSSPNRSPQ